MANCTKCGSNEHNTTDCPHGFFSNKCSHCGSVDHPSSACPHGFFSSKCGSCGSTEHSTLACPHGFFSSKCKNCGSVDHATSNCPHGIFTDHCANCGSKNHSTSQCPQRKLPSGMNGLIALVVIVALLLALFSTPFKIIDSEFSSFGFEWLSNRDVWLFCFASWMSLAFIFHVTSRVIRNKNATAEERFGNPYLSLGFFTLFLSFVAAMFIFYRFQNDFILFYVIASTIIVTIVYLIFKKSQPKKMLGAIAMGWVVVSFSAFYVFKYSDKFPINGSIINNQTVEETNSNPAYETQPQPIESNESNTATTANIDNIKDTIQQTPIEGDVVTIDTEDAKSVYTDFSEAIVNEDHERLTGLLNDNLEFWHSKSYITKQDVFDDMSNYQKKWHVLSVDINNFISKGDNLFEYEILYQIERRTDPTDVKKYEITGEIKLSSEKKILGVKDVNTQKLEN